MREEALISMRGVSRVFLMGEIEVSALRDVDLSIGAGECLVILGPSGSGKTTLLNLVGGMDRPSSGEVRFRDRDLSSADEDALTLYRRREIGFIFQFYNLVPTLTARENVQVATELADEAMDVSEALSLVGLADRADHFPAQLSGGEQQRVAIARAMAKHPSLLLADEPTGALDLETARGVLQLLQDLNRDRGLTIVVITHNPAIAAIANRVVKLVSGRVAEISENERPSPASEVSW